MVVPDRAGSVTRFQAGFALAAAVLLLLGGPAGAQSATTTNVLLLADLFHMNIEEPDPAGALREAGRYIGHVHFVDTNRRPAGLGHLDYPPIAAALKEMKPGGYVIKARDASAGRDIKGENGQPADPNPTAQARRWR